MASTKRMEKRKGKVKTFLKSNLFMLCNLVGISVGFLIGFIIRTIDDKETILLWIGLPGDLYMSLLKMCIIPLIVSAVITSTASLDPRANGKVGGISTLYFVSSNMVGATIGACLALAIDPGRSLDNSGNEENVASQNLMKPTDIFIDMLRNILPDNIVRATIQKVMTMYELKGEIQTLNNNGSLVNMTVLVPVRKIGYSDSTNILGLIVVCSIIGLATGRAKQKGKPFLKFMQSAQNVIVIVLGWFIWTTPIGISSLIGVTVGKVDDLGAAFMKLGLFILTVFLGVLIQQLVYYPLVHFIFTRTNPFKISLALVKGWSFAFAASLSISALGEMLKFAKSLKSSEKVSNFVIYYGITIHGGGSAMFQGAAVVFLAGVSNITLDSTQIVLLIFVVALSCLAVPSIPSGSIIMVLIVLTTLQLPTHDLGVLFAVEWLLDRLRTTSNLMGDVFGMALVAEMCQKEAVECQGLPQEVTTTECHAITIQEESRENCMPSISSQL